MISTQHRTLVHTLLGISLLATQASHATTFGSLSNFDVYNDTIDALHPSGTTYYGFEIELQGIDQSQVWQNGGTPYTYDNFHYGPGQVSSAGGNTYIRYFKGTPGDLSTLASTTPWNGTITATDGHACITIDGCEHFGTVLSANPTATRYFWLDSNGNRDTSNPINLLAPIQTVVQPALPAQPAVVQAVVVAPPPEPAPVLLEFGDALWVKVYKTEAKQADVARLEDLMADNPDKIADASDGPAETEWKLLQRNNFNEADPRGILDSGEQEVAGDTEQVLRTFMFFKFNGSYDPESHEAICSDGVVGGCEDLANAGLADADIGHLIGQQMMALDLNPDDIAPVPVPAAAWLFGSALLGLGISRRRR